MSVGTAMALVVLLGLAVAAVMRARAASRLKPVLERAARKHNAEIERTFLGMPRLVKRAGNRTIRMTPMNVSISSPEGGGEMTCVDVDLQGLEVDEFRIRERADARRNAVPAVLMGKCQPFAIGIASIDARYSLVGSNHGQATRILTDTAVIESIAALPPGADVHIRHGRCYVTAKGYPQHIDFVDGLFAAAERLLASVERHVAR